MQLRISNIMHLGLVGIMIVGLEQNPAVAGDGALKRILHDIFKSPKQRGDEYRKGFYERDAKRRSRIEQRKNEEIEKFKLMYQDAMGIPAIKELDPFYQRSWKYENSWDRELPKPLRKFDESRNYKLAYDAFLTAMYKVYYETPLHRQLAMVQNNIDQLNDQDAIKVFEAKRSELLRQWQIDARTQLIERINSPKEKRIWDEGFRKEIENIGHHGNQVVANQGLEISKTTFLEGFAKRATPVWESIDKHLRQVKKANATGPEGQ